jgi:hypothetical protein
MVVLKLTRVRGDPNIWVPGDRGKFRGSGRRVVQLLGVTSDALQKSGSFLKHR